MQHSAFAVDTQSFTYQGVTFTGRYGIAGGDLTGSRPTGDATWHGAMVGTPATGGDRGHQLHGDATLIYDMSGGNLDARFSNIYNTTSGTLHSTPDVRFNDVPVSQGGTFQDGQTGNRIQGGFYGPGHAETAGVFEKSNIVGAFGAKRQQ